MSEKLASAEIAESRKRFEKAFAAKYYTADQIAKGTMADLWEQAERDTRERCAQIAENFCGQAAKAIAKLIRGVNR